MASVSFDKVEKAYGTTKVIQGVGFRHSRRRVRGLGGANRNGPHRDDAGRFFIWICSGTANRRRPCRFIALHDS